MRNSNNNVTLLIIDQQCGTHRTRIVLLSLIEVYVFRSFFRPLLHLGLEQGWK